MYGKKPIVSVTYENETISIKNSLPYLKCVLSLSWVVHGSIYGRFMSFYANGFLYIERKPLLKTRECLKSWLAMIEMYMRDWDRLSEVLAIPEHVR